MSRAYRQGYLDASSAALLHTPKPSRSTSAVPPPLYDFASDHPYTTIASIGALGTLTLLSSSYLATRAWRGLMRRPPTTMSQGHGMAPRLDDLERRLVGHVQAANRDRRSELEGFRRELLGQIAVAQQAGPKIISAHAAKTPTAAPMMPDSTATSDPPKGQTASTCDPTMTTTAPTPTPSGGGMKTSSSSILAAAPSVPITDEAQLGRVVRGSDSGSCMPAEPFLIDDIKQRGFIEIGAVKDVSGATDDVLDRPLDQRELDSAASFARIESAVSSGSFGLGSVTGRLTRCRSSRRSGATSESSGYVWTTSTNTSSDALA